jgi:DNA invertase Pin-like site-specific DNA recombinase
LPGGERVNRAALYLRVSTEEQTVENQRPELVKMARARGLKVGATYEENASAVKERPAFAKMMADAHAGRFDVLIIWAIDRFGRTMAGNLADVMALDARGVRIISARESWLEMDGPARSLLVAVFSWVAEQERRRLSERTRAGLERVRARGVRIGRPAARIDWNEVEAFKRKFPAWSPATLAQVADAIGVARSTYAKAAAERARSSTSPKKGIAPKGAQRRGTRLLEEESGKGPLSR